MTRRQLLLACFAATEGGTYEPVQIQKLVFLFQEKSPKLFPEKLFIFKPYDYGPFDQTLYTDLEQLTSEGLLEIYYGWPRCYVLTKGGISPATEALASIKEPYKDLLVKLSAWIRKISFAELVGAVYKEYPAMRANSVFKDD